MERKQLEKDPEITDLDTADVVVVGASEIWLVNLYSRKLSDTEIEVHTLLEQKEIILNSDVH
jgi:hypothetical protein